MLPQLVKVAGHRVLLDGVSPFGNLRIKGCLAPPRSISQLNHVLHRLLQSRHPPHALTQNSRYDISVVLHHRSDEVKVNFHFGSSLGAKGILRTAFLPREMR